MKLEYIRSGDYFIPICLKSTNLQMNDWHSSCPKWQAAGITEQLKATEQMKWVGLMSAVKAQAEEIIFTELVYA